MKKNPRTASGAFSDVAYDDLCAGVVSLLEHARRTAGRSINHVMTVTYWEIGRRIVEHEQQGSQRAEYGQRLLDQLAKDLTKRLGRGFSRTNPVKPRKKPNISYGLLRAIYPAFRVLFPNQVIRSDDLALEIVDVAIRKPTVAEASSSRTVTFERWSRRFIQPIDAVTTPNRSDTSDRRQWLTDDKRSVIVSVAELRRGPLNAAPSRRQRAYPPS
jgi:DUF1016 N-terminal domain